MKYIDDYIRTLGLSVMFFLLYLVFDHSKYLIDDLEKGIVFFQGITILYIIYGIILLIRDKTPSA